LNHKRVVRLSPNYATPIPIAGDPSFFTVTEKRYLPLGDGKRTVIIHISIGGMRSSTKSVIRDQPRRFSEHISSLASSSAPHHPG
jgi:hypothetical protein